MKHMQIVRLGAILLAVSFAGGKFTATANADESDYGPDWPICRNLDLDPKTEIMACTRLLQSGKLTQQHTSWSYNNRGTAWVDLQRLDLAVSDFSKAMEIDPSNFAPHYNMAGLYFDSRRYDTALAEMDRAIELKPDGDYLYEFKGRVLDKLGKRDDAIVTYSKALELNPLNERALVRRNIAYYYTGQFELALRDISVLIDHWPMRPEYWASRGQYYAAQSQHDKAIADFNKSLALAPDYLEVYPDRATSYFALGKYALARADCEFAIARDPSLTVCTGYIARSLMLEGKTEAAIGRLSEMASVADVPAAARDPLVLLSRGALRYSQGAYGAANEDFASAIAQDPMSPYGYLWKYLAGRRLGVDDKQALAELVRQRDIWPAPVIRYVLGEISAQDMLASTDVPNAALKKQRTAEANFYLGELAAIGGNEAAATAYFNAAIDAGEIEISPILPAQNLRYLYKSNDDIEVSLAKTALQGKTL